jgi:hypothetical protein
MKEVLKTLDIARKYQNYKLDSVFTIVGGEGVGKSTFVLNCVDYLGGEENCICIDKNKMGEVLTSLKEKDPLQIDEAADGLYSKEGVSKFNKELEKLFMICRAKLWITFILIPDFFALSPMFRRRRINGLFHIYKRGRVKFYDKKAIEKINRNHDKYKSHEIRGAHQSYTDSFPNYKGKLLEGYNAKKNSKVSEMIGDFNSKIAEPPKKDKTRKEEVAELLQAGWKGADIARKLKMAPTNVSAIKKEVML